MLLEQCDPHVVTTHHTHILRSRYGKDHAACLIVHTIVSHCKEEGVDYGDAKESLVETIVFHQLSDQPALVKDELLQGCQLSILSNFWPRCASVQSLYTHTKMPSGQLFSLCQGWILVQRLQGNMPLGLWSANGHCLIVRIVAGSN